MPLRSLLPLGALAALLAAAPAAAQNVQVGALNCDVSGGIGLIIGSQRTMICAFQTARGEVETYTGTISRFGLDIGATAGGPMIWNVYAPSGATQRYALAGSYAGASGEFSAGAGLGANVLIGGSNRSYALQPLSIQAQLGLNLALGVAALELRAAR